MVVTSWNGGPIALGCGTFGGIGGAQRLIGKGLDSEQSLQVLDEADALGIFMLDTAESYAGGESDRTIGRWLKDRATVPTEAVKITTKVAPSETATGASYAWYLEETFARSLGRLGVDRVEWLLTHAPDPETPIEITLEALESVAQSGRCAHIGGCNLNVRDLESALDASDRLGLRGYELVQNGYSLLVPDADEEVRSLCHERGIAYIAFSPLAGGALTGKYRRGERPPSGTRLDLRPDGVDGILTEDKFDAIERLVAFATNRGVEPAAVALAWLLHRDDVTALITGPARPSPHLSAAAQATSLELDDDSIEQLTSRFST